MRTLALACLACLLLPAAAHGQPDSPEEATRPPVDSVPAPPAEGADAPAPEPVERAFERLEQQLQSKEPDQRRLAAVELGHLGDVRAGALLLSVLEKDPAPEVRAGAAVGLGVLKNREARGALDSAAVRDPSAEVRRAARAALVGMGAGQLPTEPPPIPPEDRQPVRHEAEARGGQVGPRTPPYARSQDYRDANKMRNAGIMVSAIGGGVGVLGALLGGMTLGLCTAIAAESFESETDCSVPTGILVAGGVTLMVSLAVGLPLALVGQKKMREISMPRAGIVPQLNLATSGDNGVFSATWRF